MSKIEFPKFLTEKETTELRSHEGRDRNWWDYETEILDEEECLIYERLKRNKKGKIKRKFFQPLTSRHDYYSRGIKIWYPRLKDIVAAEQKRWKAQQYLKSQLGKIKDVFSEVVNTAPFCCIIITDTYPGFNWVVFESSDCFYGGKSQKGLSQHITTERPDCPLHQKLGDDYFYYDRRSNEIRKRVHHFDLLLNRAIEEKFYNEIKESTNKKLILTINNRQYIIGQREGSGYQGYSFGIISYPEDILYLNL